MKSTTDGGLSWTNAPSATLTTIFYNTATGDVEWVDPNGAQNPNWSLNGNAIPAAGRLGTTTAGGSINIVTGLTGLTRMTVEANGNINIATDAANGGDVTIGNDNAVNVNGATIGVTGTTNINTTGTATTSIGAAAGTTTVSGTTTITGTTNINNAAVATTNIGFTGGTLTTAGSLGHTGTSSFTGAVTLAGAASPLVANTGAGAIGDVLVSAGGTVTPSWQSLNDAIGIRKAGKQSVTGATSATVTGVTGLLAGDAIIVTIEGATGVSASVFARDIALGTFTVRFSGEYTGDLNFMVIKTL
jgi:hypothetical protein